MLNPEREIPHLRRDRVMKILAVSTVCPFCGGGVSLLREPSELTAKEITGRFVGARLECQHPGCGRSFAVRRGDLHVRRVDA